MPGAEHLAPRLDDSNMRPPSQRSALEWRRGARESRAATRATFGEGLVKALLKHLLRVFPEAFRSQFGSGMCEQIERDYDLARARGRLAATWFAMATAVDLLRAGIAERWS